jgi:hypothetical protein
MQPMKAVYLPFLGVFAITTIERFNDLDYYGYWWSSTASSIVTLGTANYISIIQAYSTTAQIREMVLAFVASVIEI